MKTKSIRFNFVMNTILTVSKVIFPLITFPYVARVLLPVGNGKIEFARSIVSYFLILAQLGIPTYGIRICAKHRDNREKLSQAVRELLVINCITTVITYILMFISLYTIPKFGDYKELILVNSIGLILNVFGMEWLYQAIEKYSYITVRNIIFKIISIVLMFVFVKDQDDYVIYAAIIVFATAGSNVFNIINCRKYVDLKGRKMNLKQHFKPILIFLGMTIAATIYTSLDAVMLGFMKTDAEVGYYNAAVKIKGCLLGVVSSLGTVLMPRMSYLIEKNRIRQFKEILFKSINFVLLLSIPIVTFVIVLAKKCIFLLSGEAYLNSVMPLQIIMLTVILIGLNGLIVYQVLIPMGKENRVLSIEICGAVVDLVLNAILIPLYGASGASLATVVAEFVVLVLACVYGGDMLVGLVKKIEWYPIVFSFAISFLGVYLLNQYVIIENIVLSLIIDAIVYFGIYGLILFLLKESIIYEQYLQFVEKLKGNAALKKE